MLKSVINISVVTAKVGNDYVIGKKHGLDNVKKFVVVDERKMVVKTVRRQVGLVDKKVKKLALGSRQPIAVHISGVSRQNFGNVLKSHISSVVRNTISQNPMTDKDEMMELKEVVKLQSAEITRLKEMIANHVVDNSRHGVVIRNVERLTVVTTDSNWAEVLKRICVEQKVTFISDENMKSSPNDNTPKVEAPLTNYIFKEKQDDGCLHLRELRYWIGDHFARYVEAKYEWFALWRVLKDKGLLKRDQQKMTDFVKQMHEWYPSDSFNGVEEAINLYKSGYLGITPFKRWDDDRFRKYKKARQSMNGYYRLFRLCSDLMDDLNVDKFILPKA